MLDIDRLKICSTDNMNAFKYLIYLQINRSEYAMAIVSI